jgi:hypothetical protein
MITYEWNNIELISHKTMYSKSNVVFMIDADLNGTEDGITENKKVRAGVTYNPSSDFIDIASVTKAKAVSWIENALGSSLLEKYKNEVAKKFMFKKVKISD